VRSRRLNESRGRGVFHWRRCQLHGVKGTVSLVSSSCRGVQEELVVQCRDDRSSYTVKTSQVQVRIGFGVSSLPVQRREFSGASRGGQVVWSSSSFNNVVSRVVTGTANPVRPAGLVQRPGFGGVKSTVRVKSWWTSSESVRSSWRVWSSS